jgi:hypothetical protein
VPKKVIGKELTQEDYKDLVRRLERDLGVSHISVFVSGALNGWLEVYAVCWRVRGEKVSQYHTHATFITDRGPHMLTVMCRHLSALYHVVDRKDAGLPPLIDQL